MDPIQARKLETRDLWTIARIARNSEAEVRQLAQEHAPTLLRLRNSEPGAFSEAQQVNMGISIVFALLNQVDSGIRPWLADMANMEVDEFDRRPLGDVFELVGQIVKQEDWPGFLGHVSGVVTSLAA